MTVIQTYEIDIEYIGRDKGAQAQADHLGSIIGGLQGHLDGVASRIERVGLAAAGMIGGAATLGVRMLVQGVTGLNSDLESTRIGMAAVFAGSHVTGNFNQGLQVAAATLEEIRTAAAAIPGETSDLVGIFRDIQPLALGTGASVHQVVEQSAQLASVAATLGLNFHEAGREYANLLAGRAGVENNLWNRMGMGVGAQQFNQMSQARRAALLGSQLQTLGGPALVAYQHSWQGLTSTVMDFAHRQQGVFTAPLFDAAKSRLESITGLLERRGPEIEAQVSRWGHELSHWFNVGYEQGERFFHYVQGNWRQLRDEVLRAGERIVGIWALARGGSAALGTASSVANVVQMLGGGASVAGAGTTAGGVVSAGGLGAAGVATGAALFMAAPALVALADGSYDTRGALTRLGGSFDFAGSQAMEMGRTWQPIIDRLGGDTLDNIVNVTNGLGYLSGGIMKVVTLIGRIPGLQYLTLPGILSLPGRVSDTVTGWLGLHRVEGNAGQVAGMNPMEQMRESMHSQGENLRSLMHGMSADQRAHLQAAASTSAHGQRRPDAARGHTTINNHFRIEQAENPERLAITMQHVLEREMRNPTQAATPGLNLLHT